MKKLLLIIIYVLCINLFSQCISIDTNVNMEGTGHYHLVKMGSRNEKYFQSIDIYESRFFVFRKYASFNFGDGYVKKNLVIGNDSVSKIGKFYKNGENLYLTLQEEDNTGNTHENTYLVIKKDSCNPSEHYYSDFELDIDLPISDQAKEDIVFFKGWVNLAILLRIGFKKENDRKVELLIYDRETPIQFDSIKVKVQENYNAYGENQNGENIAIQADKLTKMQLIDSIRDELRNIWKYQRIYFACNNLNEQKVKYMIISNISSAWKRDIDEAVKGKIIPFLLFKIRENRKITYYQTQIGYSDIAKELAKESNFKTLSVEQLQELLKANLNDKSLIYIDYLPSLTFGEYIYFHTQLRLALYTLRNEYALKKYQKTFDELEEKEKNEISDIYPFQFVEPSQIHIKTP